MLIALTSLVIKKSGAGWKGGRAGLRIACSNQQSYQIVGRREQKLITIYKKLSPGQIKLFIAQAARAYALNFNTWNHPFIQKFLSGLI